MQRESWRAFRDVRSVDASASSISSLTGDRATLGGTQMQIGLHSTSSPSSAQSPDQGVAELPLCGFYEPSPLLPFQFQRMLQESLEQSPAVTHMIHHHHQEAAFMSHHHCCLFNIKDNCRNRSGRAQRSHACTSHRHCWLLLQ